MELTRKEIEGIATGKINPCDMCDSKIESPFRAMAQMLLAEIDKPGVWDKAPNDATFASVNYCPEQGKPYKLADKHYFFYRELPKTRIDEIAEEAVDKYQRGAVGAISLTDTIKSAILKYAEESK